jgi:hypothetical protein
MSTILWLINVCFCCEILELKLLGIFESSELGLTREFSFTELLDEMRCLRCAFHDVLFKYGLWC